MFERRLKILLVIAGVAALVIVGRLVELQLVQGAYYRERAEEALVRRPRPLPFVRGSILDRRGETLVADEACWDVAIDYDVIKADAENDLTPIWPELRRWQRQGLYPQRHEVTEERNDQEAELAAAFWRGLDAMWADLAALTAAAGTPLSVAELRQQAGDIHRRIQLVRALVAERRGFDSPVAEETTPHAVFSGLDGNAQIVAREHLAAYPWVHVLASSTRRYAADAEPFAHVAGRVGRVDADAVANDPAADDPFAKYLGSETRGVTGVEWLAERALRGRRGQITLDREGAVIAEGLVEPQNGEDIRLTIRADLQRRLYRLLGEAVQHVPESSGGAVVVLDVPTREVLALVSYPAYDPNRFDELFPTLRDDTARLPLWFRTVASGYAPGSTIKPLVCLAGLMSGKITLDSQEMCTGYLLEGVHDRWRCWQIHGTNQRMAHGTIDVVDALKGSCNVFMYRLGEKLGVDRICGAFDMAGVGRPTGLGLREEVSGINPTPGWLAQNTGRSVTPGTPRLYAMGQGEVLMTPAQVANLMATYASGVWRPLTLLRRAEPAPAWKLPARPEHTLAIRRGMYGVVNDPTGTAYKPAYFAHERYALCGKTGSATAGRRPTAYVVSYLEGSDKAAKPRSHEATEPRSDEGTKRRSDELDGRISTATVRERVGWSTSSTVGEPNRQPATRARAWVPAGSLSDAIQRFTAEHPDATFEPADIELVGRWPPRDPPDGSDYSHAWFGGFLQRLDAAGQPDWSVTPKVAFAVLVEYGGSGGRTSGPLAKAITAELLEVLGPELDPDYEE